MTRRTLAAALLLLGSLLGGPASRAAAVPEGCDGEGYVEALVDGGPRLNVETARTDAERARGLMFRDHLPWDNGMIFIYQTASRGGYWMGNTYVPLSIAFIDREGTILNIENMLPIEGTAYPTGPYLYALETSWGWYEWNKVKPGDKVRICVT
ncbi:MAG: DUF192 domain-containing protein [Chloroflexota bacterium]